MTRNWFCVSALQSIRLTHDPDVDHVGGVLPLQVVGGAGVVARVLTPYALENKVLALGQDSNPGLWSSFHPDTLKTNEI